MKHRISENQKRPAEFPPLPLWAEGNMGYFDPMGSYTGLTEDLDGKPVQDADDL